MDDRLLHYEVRLGEAGVHVAHAPLHGRLAHRELPFLRCGEVGLGPLHLSHALAIDRVSVQTRVCPPRTQTLKRIQHEGQRLEVDLDLFDRVGSRRLIHRRHREDRLAHVVRFVGQGTFPRGVRIRQIVGGQDVDDAGHRERAARVDASHPRVRHRAQQELGEEHPLRAEVLCEPGSSSDLGHEIGWGDVLANQPFCHDLSSPPGAVRTRLGHGANPV